jgi:hypothetical protein
VSTTKLENVCGNFQKNKIPLDKFPKIWYHKDTEKGNRKTFPKIKKFFKKLKKGLDRFPKI